MKSASVFLLLAAFVFAILFLVAFFPSTNIVAYSSLEGDFKVSGIKFLVLALILGIFALICFFVRAFYKKESCQESLIINVLI